jgi:signal transduction histidine kinase
MLMAVAHDLRTPLTSLRVRSEDAPQELRAGMLRDIARVERMVDGVLSFAATRAPREDATAVNFCSVVQESVEGAQRSGRAIDSRLGEACVRGNAVELSRAADNLIQNAVKFGRAVRVTVLTDHDVVRLSVRDDGPGVPAEFLTQLTEPFFRVDPSRSAATGGLGLGLATAAAIVAGHQGRLTFRNLPRGGFEASMELPAWSRQFENSDTMPVSTR